MNVRGIIFDKDGTLFDFGATWETWAENVLMRATKGDRTRATTVGKAVGFDMVTRQFSASSIVIAGTSAEIAEAFVAHFPEYSRDTLLNMLNSEAEQAPQIEAAALGPVLSDLKQRGIKLGVATNDSIDPAVSHLKSAKILEYFSFVAGYDSGFGGKPEPGQLLAFSKRTRIPPEACVMVGDSLHDLRAGRAAGMRTIGVLTGMARASVLEPYADIVLPDIGHIARWLDAIAAD